MPHARFPCSPGSCGTLDCRVLSRVWHAEHGLGPASVMADEALKAWMVSSEGKVARLVSKDKSNSRAATAV